MFEELFKQAHEEKTKEVHVDTIDNGYIVTYFDNKKRLNRSYYCATPQEVGSFVASYYETMPTEEGVDAEVS